MGSVTVINHNFLGGGKAAHKWNEGTNYDLIASVYDLILKIQCPRARANEYLRASPELGHAIRAAVRLGLPPAWGKKGKSLPEVGNEVCGEGSRFS